LGFPFRYPQGAEVCVGAETEPSRIKYWNPGKQTAPLTVAFVTTYEFG